MAENSSETKHFVCLEDSRVVAEIDHYGKRKTREALEIVLKPDHLNREEGCRLSENWKLLTQLIKKK